MIHSQNIKSNQNEEVLAGAAAMSCLLSPPNNNSTSMNISQNSARMKCFFCHEQNCFLDYFDNPVPDDAVIYISDNPFQFNERESRCTEFVGNPTGIIFVATKMG